MVKGLVIKSPYIDLILSGKKTWEIRGSNTNIRGKIALIKSGSGLVYGEVELVDAKEITLEEYNKHCLELFGKKISKLPYKRTYAWSVKNPVIYDEPKKYKHPVGAIIWVNLKEF